MIKLDLLDINFDLFNNAAALLLKDENNSRAVILWIGSQEAKSIITGMKKINQFLPKPLAHDLTIDVMKMGEVKLKEVVINKVEKSTFSAYLKFLTKDDIEVVIDARPSDAIALAVRQEAPVYITEEVFGQVSVPIVFDNSDDDGDGPKTQIVIEKEDNFKEFVENISPQDFINYGKEKLHISEGDINQ